MTSLVLWVDAESVERGLKRDRKQADLNVEKRYLTLGLVGLDMYISLTTRPMEAIVVWSICIIFFIRIQYWSYL